MSQMMSFSMSPMVCQSCRHEWEQQMLRWAPVGVCIAHWKTIRCPVCAANWRKIAFVTRKEDDDAAPE